MYKTVLNVTELMNISHSNLFAGEGEHHEFYVPLKKALADARIIVNEDVKRLGVLVDKFHSKYGISIQGKNAARKAEKNKRKERKRSKTGDESST